MRFSVLEYQRDVRSWQDYNRQSASHFQESYVVFLRQSIHDGHENKDFTWLEKGWHQFYSNTNDGSPFLSFLSMTTCIPLSTAWWMWSCSLSTYHLLKQSRWTLEFSWSNKIGFKCENALKGLETYKKSFSDRNNLQQKQYYLESIFEYTNHDLRTI